MSFKESSQGDIVVIAPGSNLRGGEETTAIHTRIKELAASGRKKVVFDLGGVTWMNSSGIGMVMASRATLKNAGGNVKLARTQKKIRDLLIMMQLLAIFEDHDTVEAAVASKWE